MTKEQQIEEEVYEEMCVGCPSENYCHENCEECDDFLERLEELGIEL